MESDAERGLARGVILQALREYWMLVRKGGEREERERLVKWLRSESMWHILADLPDGKIEDAIRHIRHGELEHGDLARRVGNMCSIPGCNKPVSSRGLCNNHESIKRRREKKCAH